MYQIKTDEQLNHLYITIGQVQASDADQIKDDILAQIPKLEEDFVCILDVSQYVPLGKEVLPHIETCRKAMIDAGLAREIRIVGDVFIPQREILGLRPSKKVYAVDIVKNAAEAAEVLTQTMGSRS